MPAVRLHRAAERLTQVGVELEAALGQADPLEVDNDVWRAAAIAAAAAGEVALARYFADAQAPTQAWPVHSAVPERVAAIRELLSILRWQSEAQDMAPRPRVVDCLTLIDEALDDIEVVVAGPQR